jgi:hypothetical protein
MESRRGVQMPPFGAASRLRRCPAWPAAIGQVYRLPYASCGNVLSVVKHQQLIIGFGNLPNELGRVGAADTLADAMEVQFDPPTQDFRSRFL